MATPKRSALGRGLDALISMDNIVTSGTSSIHEIELSQIVPNPDQPRREFDQEALEELASSIRELGIIQPISLRQVDGGNYQIIAGERRYRAAQMAGLETIPAYVRTVEDETLMEMALIENIQREDLNSIEIALAFQKLIELYQLTQEKLSERVGKKRTTIANYLRLLKLPAEVQIGLRDKRIDMGHARALLSVADPALQLELYERILSDGLSVRSVEDLAKTLSAGGERARKKAQKKVMMRQEYNVLKSHLSDFFNAKVQFTCDEKGKGKISIPFKNEEDLERIIGISGDMGLRRAVIIIFIIALLPLSILEVKADSNIGYQGLVEVEVNSADTVEMENARYNRPDSISVISGDSVGALFQDSVPVMITDSLGGLAPSDSLGLKAASRKSWRPSDFNPDPMRAVWLSALFPGLGQIYNHRYWKLPIVVGGYVGLFYATTWNSRMLSDYQRAYLDIMDSDPGTNSYMDFFSSSYREEDIDKEWLTRVLKQRKDYYRQNRDLCIICMIGLYAVCMIDAYVDAQLYHFDVSPDISMKWQPAIIPTGRTVLPSIGLQCAITF